MARRRDGTSSSIGGRRSLLYQHSPGPVVRSTLGAAFLVGTGFSFGALLLVGEVGRSIGDSGFRWCPRCCSGSLRVGPSTTGSIGASSGRACSGSAVSRECGRRRRAGFLTKAAVARRRRSRDPAKPAAACADELPGAENLNDLERAHAAGFIPRSARGGQAVGPCGSSRRKSRGGKPVMNLKRKGWANFVSSRSTPSRPRSERRGTRRALRRSRPSPADSRSLLVPGARPVVRAHEHGSAVVEPGEDAIVLGAVVAGRRDVRPGPAAVEGCRSSIRRRR